MGWVWSLALMALACSSPPPPAAPANKPADRIDLQQRFGGKAPTVRVHLRSFEPWTTLPVKGKGGLRVTTAKGTRDAQQVTLTRTDEGVLLDDSPARHALVTLEANGGVLTIGTRLYSGVLVIDRGHLGNHVSMENYVLGVLRGEIPIKGISVGAAEAQAIAVRSYTFHYLIQNGDLADLDDTTLFQVYAGLRYVSVDKTLRKGVNNTSGQYLEWEGAPLKAYYHSTCGGHTTDVPTGLDRDPVGCMSGVPCDWCKASKYYRWDATISSHVLLRKVRMDGNLQQVEIAQRGAGDRARTVTVTTSAGKQRFHGNELRLRIGASKIRSTRWLDLNLGQGSLRIRGGGWGHGVGLCQMGAIGRGAGGQTGAQIVLAYYSGATISRAY